MPARVQRFELERAPLVYAVAQVKFSAIENIAKSIPEFQDKLRKSGYPRMTSGQLMNLTFSLAAAPETIQIPRWEFHDRDRRASFVLMKDAISLHVTQYSGFEEFCSRLKAGLDILDEVVGPALIERLGLRYVDLIRLGEGTSFHQYVNAGLLGIRDDRAGVTESSCMVNYVGKTEVGILSVRSLQRMDGNVLPPDLQPVTLVVPDVPRGEKILTLDIDHYSDFPIEPIEFNSADALDRLWQLHDNITKAFLAATTSTALSEWGLRKPLAEWAREDRE